MALGRMPVCVYARVATCQVDVHRVRAGLPMLRRRAADSGKRGRFEHHLEDDDQDTDGEERKAVRAPGWWCA